MGSLARASTPRPGRGVSDGGRPPVGGRFRQPDRTPFFLLTPVLGLRSLRNNGYVLSQAGLDSFELTLEVGFI